MTRVYIENSNAQVTDLIYMKLGWRLVKDPDNADRIIFSTGSAVWPTLYGEKKMRGVRVDIERDIFCMGLYARALQRNIPMVGICRGAQFLHVMNGGRMWQSVDGHTGQHELTDDDGTTHKVASWHHQMMRDTPEAGGKIVSTASVGHNKRTATRTHHYSDNPKTYDLEVVWYEKTRSLCYQAHPEYGTGNFEHFEKMLKRFELR